LGLSHKRGIGRPIRNARRCARLAAGADGSSADHGRGLDPRRLALHPAAPLRDRPLDQRGAMELRVRLTRRLILAAPAARLALADRQYRFPPYPSSQPAGPELPAATCPCRCPKDTCRARAGLGGWIASALADLV